MHHSGNNHRGSSQQGSNPKANGYPSDRGYSPIQHHDVEDSHGGGHKERLRWSNSLPNVAGIFRKTDVTRCDLQRSAEDELPDEKKCYQAAIAFPAKTFAQVDVASSRSRHGGAQLAPDHSVGNSDGSSNEPAQHRLWSSQRRHQQRDCDKWPDADHV